MKRFPTGRMYGSSRVEVLHPDLCCIVNPFVRCIYCRNVVCEECLAKCWPPRTVGMCCVWSSKKTPGLADREGCIVCSWEFLYQ